MKCCCECHCGVIPSRDALNDRLYWVKIVTGPFEGTKCAAWRCTPEGRYQWTVAIPGYGGTLNCIDETIRIVHEIIPE